MKIDGIVRGGELARQTQVEVVLRFEKLIGRAVDVWELVFDIEDVRDRVFAGLCRGPARQANPLEELADSVALDAEDPSGNVMNVRRAARIHPIDRVHQ